jgi:hypothetical protein
VRHDITPVGLPEPRRPISLLFLALRTLTSLAATIRGDPGRTACPICPALRAQNPLQTITLSI